MKRKLEVIKEKNVYKRKHIKVLQNKTARLKKNIQHLKYIMNDLYSKRLVSDHALKHLKSTFSGSII